MVEKEFLSTEQIKALGNQEIKELLSKTRVKTSKVTFPYMKKGRGIKLAEPIDYKHPPQSAVKFMNERNKRNNQRKLSFERKLEGWKEELQS